MKKIISSALIICAFFTSAMAQEFRFGLTASPVFDWFKVDGDQFENDGTKFGFQYGLLFDQTIGSVERYAFSTGILINYVNGGITGSDTALGLESTLELRVQYIEVPLTIRLRTNEVNYMTYYGQFGLSPGVCIKARGDVSSNGTLVEEDINFRDKDNIADAQYQLVNVSLTLGAGLEYSLAENTAVMAGIFFQNGFSNVLDDDIDDNNVFVKQFGIRLGVLF
ncbi:MAG: porin family protein [Chitinophagales bacterium]